MEGSPLIEKESGINRVVGVDEQTEQDLLGIFERRLNSNVTTNLEKEKSPELLELINRTNMEMAEFLSQYGVKALNIPESNIHILDKTKLSKEELEQIYKKYGTENGLYLASNQGVGILKDYDSEKLSFMQTMVHEFLHLQGFYSYQKAGTDNRADIALKHDGQQEEFNIRRSGFSIGTRDGKQLLFHKLNESVITELEIRFEKAFMVHWPELKNDFEEREAYIKESAERRKMPVAELRKIVAGVKKDTNGNKKWVTYAYEDERKNLNSLIKSIYEKNQADFSSEEEVFKVFADATMTGRLLPAARLIEKTFGTGSFRYIGEQSSDK